MPARARLRFAEEAVVAYGPAAERGPSGRPALRCFVSPRRRGEGGALLSTLSDFPTWGRGNQAAAPTLRPAGPVEEER